MKTGTTALSDALAAGPQDAGAAAYGLQPPVAATRAPEVAADPAAAPALVLPEPSPLTLALASLAVLAVCWRLIARRM